MLTELKGVIRQARYDSFYVSRWLVGGENADHYLDTVSSTFLNSFTPACSRFLDSLRHRLKIDDHIRIVVAKLRVSIVLNPDWIRLEDTREGTHNYYVYPPDMAGPVSTIWLCSNSFGEFMKPLGNPKKFWVNVEPVLVIPQDEPRRLQGKYHVLPCTALEMCWPEEGV